MIKKITILIFSFISIAAVLFFILCSIVKKADDRREDAPESLLNNVTRYSENITNHIEFKLVLSPDTIGDKEYDKVEYKIENSTEELFIEKIAKLTEKDIDRVVIRKTGSKYEPIGIMFRFNEAGKEKLFEITKEGMESRLAMFIGGQIVLVPMIKEPITSGEMVLFSQDWSEAELETIIRKTGIEPQYEIVPYTEEEKRKDEEFERMIREGMEGVNKEFEKQGKPIRYEIEE